MGFVPYYFKLTCSVPVASAQCIFLLPLSTNQNQTNWAHRPITICLWQSLRMPPVTSKLIASLCLQGLGPSFSTHHEHLWADIFVVVSGGHQRMFVSIHSHLPQETKRNSLLTLHNITRNTWNWNSFPLDLPELTPVLWNSDDRMTFRWDPVIILWFKVHSDCPFTIICNLNSLTKTIKRPLCSGPRQPCYKGYKGLVFQTYGNCCQTPIPHVTVTSLGLSTPFDFH